MLFSYIKIASYFLQCVCVLCVYAWARMQMVVYRCIWVNMSKKSRGKPEFVCGARVGWLGSDAQGPPCLYLSSAEMTSIHSLLGCFTWLLGIKVRSSCLHGKHFTDWITYVVLIIFRVPDFPGIQLSSINSASYWQQRLDWEV